jgi:hypothetical protein
MRAVAIKLRVGARGGARGNEEQSRAKSGRTEDSRVRAGAGMGRGAQSGRIKYHICVESDGDCLKLLGHTQVGQLIFR